MNRTKKRILQAAVVFFLLLYAFTMLAWGVERLIAPTVTPIRVKRSSVMEQRDFAATVSLLGNEIVLHWRMGQGEVGLLEGGNGQCYYYTQTAGGLQRVQGKCTGIAVGEEPNADGYYPVTATLEGEFPPARDKSVFVCVTRLTTGVQTVPVSAISYVDGVSCLMQLVQTAGGWQVQAKEVSVSASNGYTAAVTSTSDFPPKALYASGAYRDLLDGEKVWVLKDAE